MILENMTIAYKHIKRLTGSSNREWLCDCGKFFACDKWWMGNESAIKNSVFQITNDILQQKVSHFTTTQASYEFFCCRSAYLCAKAISDCSQFLNIKLFTDVLDYNFGNRVNCFWTMTTKPFLKINFAATEFFRCESIVMENVWYNSQIAFFFAKSSAISWTFW